MNVPGRRPGPTHRRLGLLPVLCLPSFVAALPCGVWGVWVGGVSCAEAGGGGGGRRDPSLFHSFIHSFIHSFMLHARPTAHSAHTSTPTPPYHSPWSSPYPPGHRHKGTQEDRQPSHPAAARQESPILPPRLPYAPKPTQAPTTNLEAMAGTRLWTQLSFVLGVAVLAPFAFWVAWWPVGFERAGLPPLPTTGQKGGLPALRLHVLLPPGMRPPTQEGEGHYEQGIHVLFTPSAEHTDSPEEEKEEELPLAQARRLVQQHAPPTQADRLLQYYLVFLPSSSSSSSSSSPAPITWRWAERFAYTTSSSSSSSSSIHPHPPLPPHPRLPDPRASTGRRPLPPTHPPPPPRARPPPLPPQ